MQRRAVTVLGTVQGVGFRPFVHALARRYRLGGFVRNLTGAVQIEVEGDESGLDCFLAELQTDPPPLARISRIGWRPKSLLGEREFRIESSQTAAPEDICVPTDVGICEACLAELLDPHDRRHRYAFINCTHCGPRLTIIQHLPYDRPQTTMSTFPICSQCRSEYDDPTDRRFHAQPIACPRCGPRLQLCDCDGEPLGGNDPLLEFALHLRAGKIGALKSLGGYHLTCVAANDAAVARLRHRKARDEKPLAVMVANLDAARRLCHVSQHEQELLHSTRRPIVLLRKRDHPEIVLSDAVAPGNPYLGLMLPCTPLHVLLLDSMAGAPLVMTSGNRSEEPIAYLNDDAQRRLGGIADVLLHHDRPIHVRCDDSVTRSIGDIELPVRRSRGYAPAPLALPLRCPQPILAVGGQFKGVFGLGVADRAIVSHHMGDLDHLEAVQQFERDIQLYQQLFQVVPQCIVHDLHPDYATTVYARCRSADEQQRLMGVQHHHAHMASCMAENGLDEPVIGVTWDGAGFGVDGCSGKPVVWGGEFLIGDYRSFRRAAHLRYVPLPGGDKAARQPWRVAASCLREAGCDARLLTPRIPAANLRTIQTMLDRDFNSPLTSSAGRLFDAVASIAGVRDVCGYEGQAAAELEWLAMQSPSDGVYPFEISFPSEINAPGVVDTRPMILAVAEDVTRGVTAARIARRFHRTLVEIVAQTSVELAHRSGLSCVVLSGGVFLNALLLSEAGERLSAAGLRVYRHRLVPPNDGGLSLGQLAIAAACLQSGLPHAMTFEG